MFLLDLVSRRSWRRKDHEKRILGPLAIDGEDPIFFRRISSRRCRTGADLHAQISLIVDLDVGVKKQSCCYCTSPEKTTNPSRIAELQFSLIGKAVVIRRLPEFKVVGALSSIGELQLCCPLSPRSAIVGARPLGQLGQARSSSGQTDIIQQTQQPQAKSSTD